MNIEEAPTTVGKRSESTNSFDSIFLIERNAFPTRDKVISSLWLDEKNCVRVFHAIDFVRKISVPMK